MIVVFSNSWWHGKHLLLHVLLKWQTIWGILLHRCATSQQDVARDEGHHGRLSQGKATPFSLYFFFVWFCLRQHFLSVVVSKLDSANVLYQDQARVLTQTLIKKKDCLTLPLSIYLHTRTHTHTYTHKHTHMHTLIDPNTQEVKRTFFN